MCSPTCLRITSCISMNQDIGVEEVYLPSIKTQASWLHWLLHANQDAPKGFRFQRKEISLHDPGQIDASRLHEIVKLSRESPLQDGSREVPSELKVSRGLKVEPDEGISSTFLRPRPALTLKPSFCQTAACSNEGLGDCVNRDLRNCMQPGTEWRRTKKVHRNREQKTQNPPDPSS